MTRSLAYMTTFLVLAISIAGCIDPGIRIEGTIVDKEDESPIAGASVILEQAEDCYICTTVSYDVVRVEETDSTGHYQLTYVDSHGCNNNEYLVKFRSTGYQEHKFSYLHCTEEFETINVLLARE